MVIRIMNEDELFKVINLISETVHSICQNDYTQAELNAWAPDRFDAKRFREALMPCYNLVAAEGENIIGFASINNSGYINRLFTHKDRQGEGIATKLLSELEAWAVKQGIFEFSLDSSKTAESFYIQHGFYKSGVSVISHRGVVFRNTVMKKSLKEGF